MREYYNGLLASARCRIPIDALNNTKSSYWGSLAEHRAILGANEKVLPELIKSPSVRDVSKLTLLHVDLHLRNIFVSETAPFDITAIIDWQSTAVEPAFIHANETPDSASREVEDEEGEGEDENSSSSSSSQPRSEKAKTKQDILLCNQAFEVCMQGSAPILAKARNTEAPLFRPFLHCNVSWRDSAPAVRQELIELSAQWNDLGLDGACPYDPTTEELEAHAEQYADFEIALDLRLGLMRSLHTDSDSWVASADWDVVKRAHDEMFREWLRTPGEDGVTDEGKARELWPFDQV
jgi:hypothetical protein